MFRPLYLRGPGAEASDGNGEAEDQVPAGGAAELHGHVGLLLGHHAEPRPRKLERVHKNQPLSPNLVNLTCHNKRPKLGAGKKFLYLILRKNSIPRMCIQTF